MGILYYLSYVALLIGIILVLFVVIDNRQREIKLKERKAKNFAILIPAKEESKVIEELLKSIKKQIDDLSCTYVIAENEFDPTCKIVKSYGGKIYVRKNIGNKKRKGYALDEALKEILKKKKYDLYFIFDADNILDKNYLNEMLKIYDKGYDIATGYRNIKNNINVITSCSGLTFSMINNLFNKINNKYKKTIIISGTGFFISGKLVELWNGYPFHSLTEDYELTLYATSNQIPTYYNDKAMFYDEQPTTMSVSIKQRTRWVKGFLEARKIRLNDLTTDLSKILGITPYLILLGGAALFLVTSIIDTFTRMFYKVNFIDNILNIIFLLVIVYFILLVFTIIIYSNENKKLNITNSLKIKSIFYNPIFLASYIICLIKALSKKDISWEKIEHTDNKIKNTN